MKIEMNRQLGSIKGGEPPAELAKHTGSETSEKRFHEDHEGHGDQDDQKHQEIQWIQ